MSEKDKTKAVEPLKTDPPKTEPPKAEPAKTEPARRSGGTPQSVGMPPHVVAALDAAQPPDLTGICALFEDVRQYGKRFEGAGLGSKAQVLYNGFCSRFSGRLGSPEPWQAGELSHFRADFEAIKQA